MPRTPPKGGIGIPRFARNDSLVTALSARPPPLPEPYPPIRVTGSFVIRFRLRVGTCTQSSVRSANSSGRKKARRSALPLMDAEPGSKVTFDEVLLSSDGETINAGTPLVKGAKVVAEVVGAGQGEEDLRLALQAPEECPPEDRAPAEVHRSADHRREGRVRVTWHTRRA